jgi:spermidine synthase
MTSSILLGCAVIPNTTTEMRLYQSGELFSIRIPGRGELMNSRVHGSEKALAELACQRLGSHRAPRVLVGGLGMGFTLAAALAALGPRADVVVAELVPEVVEWNRTFLGAAAGHPLDDARSSIFVGDVGHLIRQQPGAFDAVLLDVDNGPEGLVRRENDWLYSAPGLQAAHGALRAGGVLAIWSASPDAPFSRRLAQAGFAVEEVVVRAHRARKGSRHHIWLVAPADP